MRIIAAIETKVLRRIDAGCETVTEISYGTDVHARMVRHALSRLVRRRVVASTRYARGMASIGFRRAA